MNKDIYFAHNIQDLKLIEVYKNYSKIFLPVMTISRDTYNYAKNNGIEDVVLIENNDNSIVDEEFYIADIIARDLDCGESEIRKSILGYSDDSLGWNYLNFFFIIHALLKIDKVFKNIISLMPVFKKIYVVNNSSYPSFHFDSLLNKSLLLKYLVERCESIILISGEFTNKENSLKKIQKKIESKFSEYSLITHIPTAFYDNDKFCEKYNLDLSSVIDIESPNWDVMINPKRIQLIEDNNFNTRYDYPEKYFLAYKELMSENFKKISCRIDNKFKFEHDIFIPMAKFHLNLKNDLENLRIFNKVKKLYISEHDAGLHGPLMYVATKNDVEINVIPHSRIQSIPLPYFPKLIRYEVYTRSNYLNLGNQENIIKNEITTKSIISAKRVKIEKILFLFNAEDDAYSIPYTNLKIFNIAFNNFLNELRSKNIEIGIRFKPGKFRSIEIKNEYTNCDGDKVGLIHWPDVCVSLFTPTSYMHEFQITGKMCYHLQEKKLNESEEVLSSKNLICLTAKKYKDLFSDLIYILNI